MRRTIGGVVPRLLHVTLTLVFVAATFGEAQQTAT